MTRTRLVPLLAAVLALVTIGAATARAAAPIYFQGADNHHVIRSKNLFLTADGTLDLDKTSWQTWGGPMAVGQGTADYHGCTPDCAAGKSHTAQVVVILSDPVSCKGMRFYDTVTLERANGAQLFEKFLTETHWAPCKAG